MNIPIRPIQWVEWDGNLFPVQENRICYFTYGHADLTFRKHQSELSKTLKVDGVVDDFMEGVALIEMGETFHGLVYTEAPGEMPSLYTPETFEESNSNSKIESGTWVQLPWE